MTTLEPPFAPSEWTRDLFDHLVHHVETERTLLEEYAHIAETTESKAFGYVVGLLLEDERRHHRLFLQLAESLKAEAELAEPVVPALDFYRVDRKVVNDITKRLLAGEEADLVELKRLRKTMREVENTSLWTMLVELMLRDTDKHIAMLKLVRQQIKHSKN